MAQRNTTSRSLHDLGLAVWFGGSLMGAVGVNGASGEVADPKDRIRVADAGWGRWTPVNLVAIVLHLIGGARILAQNRGRLAGQQQVGSWAATKAGLTLAALGVTAYARVQGQKLMDVEADAARNTPPGQGLEGETATEPAVTTPQDVADAQRRLRSLQWVIPALTGAMVVVNAKMGEQQRPGEVARGLIARLNPAR